MFERIGAGKRVWRGLNGSSRRDAFKPSQTTGVPNKARIDIFACDRRPKDLLSISLDLTLEVDTPRCFAFAKPQLGVRNFHLCHPTLRCHSHSRGPHRIPRGVVVIDGRDGVELYAGCRHHELVARHQVVVRVDRHEEEVGAIHLVTTRQVGSYFVWVVVVHHCAHVHSVRPVQHTDLSTLCGGLAFSRVELNEVGCGFNFGPIGLIKHTVDSYSCRAAGANRHMPIVLCYGDTNHRYDEGEDEIPDMHSLWVG